MDAVTAINVHRFGAGLLVELIGEGADGEVAVRSFEFEWANPEHTQVRPVGGLGLDDVRLIENRLVAAGYEVLTDAAEAPSKTVNGSSSPIQF